MKYSDELKKQMFEDVVVKHEKMSVVAGRYGMPYKALGHMISRAKANGIESCLHANNRGRYSESFKLEVVRYIWDGHAISGAARRFNIDPSLARTWYKKYAEGGDDALRNSRRGEILEQDTNSTDDKAERRVHTESEYQELEKRLRWAEMENKFLKKLNALVQERIERERKRWPR